MARIASTTARCQPLLRCFDVAWSVDGSVTTVSPAKTAEPIEMSFRRQTHVGPRNYVLDCGTYGRRHLANTNEGSMLGSDAGCRYTMVLYITVVILSWRQLWRVGVLARWRKRGNLREHCCSQLLLASLSCWSWRCCRPSVCPRSPSHLSLARSSCYLSVTDTIV